MTFQDLIAHHRQALRAPQPIPTERRNRIHRPRRRPIFTDWASI